jgi:hypothetical protein
MLRISDAETRIPQSAGRVEALTTPRIGRHVASGGKSKEGTLQGQFCEKTANRPRPALQASAKEEE